MKVFALLLAGAALAAAQPGLLEYVPPQSKVVIGLNLRHIIDAAQLPDLNSPGAQAMSMQMLLQNGMGGLNPLKDVDSLVIASTGEGENPPSVIILNGRFGSLKLGAKKDPKSEVVRVGDNLLVAGDPSMVQAVTRHRAGATGMAPDMAERVMALAAKYDVWGTGGDPKGFAAAKGQGSGLESLDRFEFGAAFQKGLTLDAEIHVKSSDDAKKLTEALQFVNMMTKAQPKQPTGSKFDLSVREGTIHLAMYIPEEELKKAIEAQKAGFAAAQAQPKPKPQPKDTEVKITKAPNGDTMMVTLPGGH